MAKPDRLVANCALLVAKLSLEQKVRLLTGADFWSLHPEPAVGLRRVVVSDGPAGVRGEAWDERSPSANIPSPTSLAATWDEARVHRLGGLLAAQARQKGVDVLLAPTVNLHRSPYGGRSFECFSEDPLLAARIGVAYVRGVQDGGVAATVKHFVANDSETQRMSLDARIDERTLRELYLAPFEAIVREARVWAVMAAYNGVNGCTMTESPLLRDVLHGEWGFDGVVMSDWFATRSTEATANAALDLAMPSAGSPWGDRLVAAVRAGRVHEALIDDKVLRLLRLAERVGALAELPDDAEPAGAAPEAGDAGVAARGAWGIDAPGAGVVGGAAGRPAPPEFTPAELAAELRAAAAAGFVLAQNNGVLPLAPAKLRRVAVLGPNAARARTLGGGSATVFPPYTVSPVDGIRAALRRPPQAAGDSVEITYAPGAYATERVPVAPVESLRLPDGSGPGAQVSFLAEDGTLLARETRATGSYTWLFSFGPEIPAERVARIEVRTRVVAQRAGAYRIGCSGFGRFRMSLAGAEVFDTMLRLSPDGDLAEGLMTPPQHVHPVTLAAGEELDLVLVREADPAATDLLGASIQLNLDAPHGTAEEELARAAALARDADVAVVVVGTTEEVESEGFDRASLALPGGQDELVRRVAAANPNTVVVVNSGAPVLLPWVDEVAAVLLAWFPGQEFGNALADVLFGFAEPGGRLPASWPAGEDGLPSTQPVDGTLRYDEGLFIGYRGYDRDGRTPRYRFGHGLGYTTWEYLDATATVSDLAAGRDPATVSGPAIGAVAEVAVRVRNSGARPGREVVQVYASRTGSAIDRPVRWLAGFATVDAQPGEEATVRVPLRRRAFEHWDVSSGAWALEPGVYQLSAGRSSGDLRLSTEIDLSRGGESDQSGR